MNKITTISQDIVICVSMLLHPLLKLRYRLRGQRRWFPSHRQSEKDSERVCPNKGGKRVKRLTITRPICQCAFTDPMLTAFVTVFSIPPAADTCAPTFQRLSTRFGNPLSSETLASSGLTDLAALISLETLNFRVWQWTILWTIIALLVGNESIHSILLNPFWPRLRTSISGFV